MTQLVQIDWTQRQMTFLGEAEALKMSALSGAARIARVDDAESNQAATNAQAEIAGLLKTVEEARTAAKAPVLAFGKQIDAQSKAFTDDLEKEKWRLGRLCGDFAQLEAKRVQAAARAEQERLDAIEAQRQRELAQAKTHEQLDAVEEKFDNIRQQEAPPIAAPIKAEGQTVKAQWKFEVFDLDALYRGNPNCVKMEPKAREITALLSAGMKLPGVRGWQEHQSIAKAPRQAAAIDV